MVAVGPGGINEFGRDWTKVMCERVGVHMDAISVHYYTRGLRGMENALPATGFGEREWALVLRDALRIEQAVGHTIATLDRYDPRGRIKVYVDEWGTWYRAEPGGAGHELFQQNTLRDALVAAMTLHVFHRHADRVAMANLAQTVNVLQALVLTERDGERMLLTPTYHVFDLLRGHHDTTVLPIDLESPVYRVDDIALPALSVSASRANGGPTHVSIANADARSGYELAVRLDGVAAERVSGRVLTADALDTHNTFDEPDRLTPRPLHGATLGSGALRVEVPPRSVIALALHP